MTQEQKTLYSMTKAYYRDKPIPTITNLSMFVKNMAMTLYPNIINEKQIQEIIDDYEINIGVKAFDPETLIGVNVNSKWFEDKKAEPNRKHLYCFKFADGLELTVPLLV